MKKACNALICLYDYFLYTTDYFNEVDVCLWCTVYVYLDVHEIVAVCSFVM